MPQLILDPSCIIEKVSETGPSLRRISQYYSWQSQTKTLQPLVEQDHPILQYGKIVSVSPSKQYCLLLGFAKELKNKQFTVLDIDHNEVISQCVLTDSFQQCNVNNMFAGFSWNEELNEILYVTFTFSN